MIHLTSQTLSAKEMVQNIFSPLIGVLCSPQADELCYKNNLSFVELLQPFSKLTNDAYIRDATGTSTSVKGIRLNFCDVNWRPPQTMVARKMLTDTVTAAQSTKTKPIQIDEKTFIDIPTSEPWFEQWREIFLSIQSQSDHEFTRHFLSCLIVLSTNDPNSLETAHLLTRKVQVMQNTAPPKVPKWFTPDALNCYVLLHDPSQGNVTSAQQAFESLKLTFGDNKCFLVQINSQQTPSSTDIIDPWLKFLRRQPKMDETSDTGSAPKTPQDVSSLSSMPLTVQMSTLETPPSGIAAEEMVDHPLSPTQEQVSDTIHSKFSYSLDSLSSQTQIVNPNVWESVADVKRGTYLTATDIDNLKHLVQDFSIRALIPYIERQIVLLNDTVSNKKSVSRSLLSATKRFFATKPGASTQSENVVVYSSDSSLELQTRKLGDLLFLFGNYSQAFQQYHQVKRDFQVDSAWQYYAGALEMAGLSAFLSNTTNASNQKAFGYLEEAIVVYLNQCKLQNLAIRCTLLSVELLKSSQLYTEGARQFIRMTSTDQDLMSGLLLEQSAYLFLRADPRQFRKYAFHVVLAGHRYSKSGQRKHSFRCYRQANQIFQNRGWDLAESHIFYTLSKQAITLKKVDEAVTALAHLLRPSNLQSAAQQASFLSEYIATQKMFLKQTNSDTLLDIGLPKVVKASVRVLISCPSPITVPNLVAASNININMNQSEASDEWKWNKLEWIAAQSASNKPIMIFKPNRSLFTYQLPTSENPLSIQGEPVEISFALENTIKPPITFDDINLLWTFTNQNGEVFTNRNLFKNEIGNDDRNSIYNIVASTFIKQIKLNEHEKKVVVMKLTPHHIGYLDIQAVVGKLATKETSSLWGKIDFEAPIIKPDGPSAADKPLQYDKKLKLTTLPPAPALHVSFTQIPVEVLAGETIPITVYLTNAGAESLNDIWVVADEPRWILGELNSEELPLSLLRDFRDLTNETLGRDKEACKQHAFKLFSSSGGVLQPKEGKTVTIWLQAPFKKGKTTLKLLFYYGTPEHYPKLRYRLVRHTWNLNVNESLCVDATCTPNNIASDEFGIDVYVKNQNQVHHALVTEIFLSDIKLFCPVYKLSHDSIKYLQSPGYNRLMNENKGLRINESIGFRCLLEKNEKQRMPATNPLDFVRNRLSGLVIKTNANDRDIPSFLMKNETKFIGVMKQVSNSEEFNQIVSTADPHMTLCLSWSATVNDNNSTQRLTFGQHFVQLRNVYETISCPPMSTAAGLQSFNEHEQKIRIYNSLPSTKSATETERIPWGPKDVNVLIRCFLEVEEEAYSAGATGTNAVN